MPQHRPEQPRETVQRIEPTRLENPPERVADLVAELSAQSARLGRSLHRRTAASLADLVRVMNTYYSNLIEGHNTRPHEIERAVAGQLEADKERRNLQIEAAAHVRVQAEVDRIAAAGELPEPASVDFIRWLHREFYRDSPQPLLRIQGADREFTMTPGEWRSSPTHDVAVGRHVPPSSTRVDEFMQYFAQRYRFDRMGKASRIIAMAAAHHRLNYIHPFADGNGRVSRLMSHAMGWSADVAAHGLWSISRGLARGLGDRNEYKRMMDLADTPRQGDLDGGGNLSQRALVDFATWFISVAIDQVTFMSSLFDLDTLGDRLRSLVERQRLKPEAARVLEETWLRGEIERGEVPRITGLPERTARRLMNDLSGKGLLASVSPKGPLHLHFPTDASALELLFPSLYSRADGEPGHTADEKLRYAITHKQLIKVSYHGQPRVVEPHDYGIHNGVEKLLVYQLRGTGPSRQASVTTGWRMLDVSKIQDCVVLDEMFSGSRGKNHRNHLKWEILYARVS